MTFIQAPKRLLLMNFKRAKVRNYQVLIHYATYWEAIGTRATVVRVRITTGEIEVSRVRSTIERARPHIAPRTLKDQGT